MGFEYGSGGKAGTTSSGTPGVPGSTTPVRVTNVIAGNTREVLYDNLAGTALEADLTSGRSWVETQQIRMTFTRALVEADDNKDLLLEIEYTAGPTTNPYTTHLGHSVSARQFRLLEPNTETSGSSIPPHIPYYVRRNAETAITTFGEMALIFTRSRHADGHDEIRVGFSSNNNNADVRDWRARISLVPNADAITVTSTATGNAVDGDSGGGLVTHYDGHGAPVDLPTVAGQVSVNNDGTVYPSGDVITTHQNPPTITSGAFSNSNWEYFNNVHEGDHHPQSVRDTNLHFYYNATYHYFYQNIAGTVTQVTWSQAMANFRDGNVTIPDEIVNRNYLGAFQTQEAVARALSRYSTRNTATFLFILEGTPQSLRRVTAYSDGTITRTDQLYWSAPLANIHDITWDNLAGKEAARPTHDEIVEHTGEIPHIWTVSDVDNAINLHDYAQIGPYHFNINRDATDVDTQAAHFLGGIYKNISGRSFQIPEVFIPVTPDGSGTAEYNIYVWKLNKVSDTSYTTTATAVANYVTSRGGTNIGFDVAAGTLAELHGYLRTPLVIRPNEYFAVGVDRTVAGSNASTIVASGTTIEEDYDGAIEYISKASFAGVFAVGGGEEVYHASTFAENMRLVFAYETPVNSRRLVEFWGEGQTEAFPPEPIDRLETARSFYRYRFGQKTPSLVIGEDFGVRALDADEITGVDLIPATAGQTNGEAAILDQQILCFPAGTYQISFFASHRADTDIAFGAWVYKINPGVDTLELYYGSGYTNEQNKPIGTNTLTNRYAQSINFHRVFTFTEISYISIIGGSFDGVDDYHGSHDLIVEKLD